jgi:hypothetical protein
VATPMMVGLMNLGHGCLDSLSLGSLMTRT